VLLLPFILHSYGATQTRFEKLIDKSKGSGIFEIESAETLKTYSLSKHNYSLFILFSTNDHNVQCPACRPSMEQFSALGREFITSLGGEGFASQKFLEHPVFLAFCDILKLKDFILQSGIVKEVPTLLYVPPRDVKSDDFLYEPLEGMSSDFSAERMAHFVTQKSHYDMDIKESEFIYYVMYILTAGLALFAFRSILPTLKENFFKPSFWFALSIGVFAFVMAGTVYNSINNPPPYYKHPHTGQLFLIYPSSRQQFVYEGLLMSALMTFVSLTFIGFGALVPQMKEVGKQRVIFLVIGFSFFVSYSNFIKIFKVKYGWYPFNY